MNAKGKPQKNAKIKIIERNEWVWSRTGIQREKCNFLLRIIRKDIIQMKLPARNREDVSGHNVPHERTKRLRAHFHLVLSLVKYLAYLWNYIRVAVGRACVCVCVC